MCRYNAPILNRGWKNEQVNHDPSDDGEGNAQYNPLDEVRINTSKDVSDAQNIAVSLIWRLLLFEAGVISCDELKTARGCRSHLPIDGWNKRELESEA